MINQYCNESLKAAIKNQYGKSLFEMLSIFQSQGLSYNEVASITGFNQATIRKHCKALGIRLFVGVRGSSYAATKSKMYSLIRSPQFNHLNVFTKSWVNFPANKYPAR
ncbi:hypothetical protein [Fangia hongkongensis]|uniref:hypothetical protein n=1 Tax=Fangia hongkongensis TaxID=270495 RepID=UPI0003709CB4|nr:hypothetical protein [Fangia hongkongensis]MBK2124028.1 hypothetical protein [Fangia hongkongensis]